MNPLSEVHASENGRPGSLNEHVNLDISGKEESNKHSAEGLSAASSNHAQTKFPDVFPSKHGSYNDIPAAKISELMKNDGLQSASTQSLFLAVNEILDDTIERKSGDIPQRIACLIKLTVQEIEQRVSKQAENLRKQSSLYKSREEKYQLKMRALETLSMGTTEENEIVMNQLQQIKTEKARIEEEKKCEEQDVVRLRSERSNYEDQISSLKQDLEMAKETYDGNSLQFERRYKELKDEFEKKIVELECLLADSRRKVKELEDISESKFLRWKRKEHGYNHFIDSHRGSLQELKSASESIRQEVLKSKRIYAEEFNHFELEVKELVYAAQNYHTVLEENRKLYNEVQDLKGNIRVYCRIRPFLPGQSQKQTTLEYIGENGELVVANPSKKGKDTHRLFKFNKVFGPAVTQEDVFRDTQPLIRSVLDGYNVCIFAYGQTGSGKTYTMTGPSLSSVEDWGVNYRALNDLFNISQSRKSSFAYEIGVQMVEIYNEQVRDLLCNDNSQKRLGIWNTTQPNGLAVPDASMHPVNSTADVLELMNIGLMNRAVGATALNERSSRSHSVLTVHVRGTDLETNTVLRGCLHLVDLAGSERVDRSEATGDRLKEAQHINKSLSALGDVISALAQKSSHVPYRNSKLTQLLQSSLGGQAKTLMFVQLNPDVESYSESVSTLKFAERVSGVELGAARSNKEGRGVRELMEQVAFLKETISKKDDEIGRLRQQKTNLNGDRRSMSSRRYGSASPRRLSIGPPRQSRRVSGEKSAGRNEKAASDLDNSSEYSDKHSEAGSQQSMDEFRHHKEFFRQSRLAVVAGGEKFTEEVEARSAAIDGEKNLNEDTDLLEFGDADIEERLSDISDGVLSMGTETDGSISSIVEYTLFPETARPSAEGIEKTDAPSKLPKPPQKQVQTGPSRLSLNKSSSKVSSSKQANIGSSSTVKSSKRWQ